MVARCLYCRNSTSSHRVIRINNEGSSTPCNPVRFIDDDKQLPLRLHDRGLEEGLPAVKWDCLSSSVCIPKTVVISVMEDGWGRLCETWKPPMEPKVTIAFHDKPF